MYKNIRIQNFKSIKDLSFEAKKLNVFLGKPNVGKSNILEALGLFCAPYDKKLNNFLSSFLRYEKISNLFFDLNVSTQVNITLDAHNAKLCSLPKPGLEFKLEINHDSTSPSYYLLSENGQVSDFISSIDSHVKKYDFKASSIFEISSIDFLLPPNGENLLSIIHKSQSLKEQIGQIFQNYGQQFTIKLAEKKFEIQRVNGMYAYGYPYSSVADTLQRYIFYTAAIESNTDSVLLLEEPEVHTFPPYTVRLADKITLDKTNQYFITTHSPYLFEKLLEKSNRDEVNVFITYLEDYQTKLRLLTSEELHEILSDSIDIFFNLDRYIE
jgi:AAA15 family ATPase/GTPase